MRLNQFTPLLRSLEMANRDHPGQPPARDAFQPFYNYLRATDNLRAGPQAPQTARCTLVRADQLAQQCLLATQRQVDRIRQADLTDSAAARLANVDAQFLITTLWLLRRAAHLAAAAQTHPADTITMAIVLFDAQQPDLADLYCAILEHPDTSGSPQPSVEAISLDHYRWCGGTLDFTAATTASAHLALEVRAALHRASQRET